MNVSSSAADLKYRFGGILENPYLSKIQRHCLDGYKVRDLKKILKPFSFERLLEVGCGLGEYSYIRKGRYVGLDNSLPRVQFAGAQYKNSFFVQADALKLPFPNKSFDAVLLANTAHHLSDEELSAGLEEIRRVSRKYIIVDDCVRFDHQNFLSRFFYNLDRGTMFRTKEKFREFFAKKTWARLVLENTHRTFPRLYVHAVFVLEV